MWFEFCYIKSIYFVFPFFSCLLQNGRMPSAKFIKNSKRINKRMRKTSKYLIWVQGKSFSELCMYIVMWFLQKREYKLTTGNTPPCNIPHRNCNIQELKPFKKSNCSVEGTKATTAAMPTKMQLKKPTSLNTIPLLSPILSSMCILWQIRI